MCTYGFSQAPPTLLKVTKETSLLLHAIGLTLYRFCLSLLKDVGFLVLIMCIYHSSCTCMHARTHNYTFIHVYVMLNVQEILILSRKIIFKDTSVSHV